MAVGTVGFGAPAGASHTSGVTSVGGLSFNYYSNVSLFGGPYSVRGYGQVVCTAPNTPSGCVPADSGSPYNQPASASESPSEVWGDGTAVRSYTYVDDMVDGIVAITRSDLEGPVNVGSSEYVSVAELVATVSEVAGKRVSIDYVDGPVGVRSRNFSHARVESLGWRARHSLRDGIAKTYPWVAEQVGQATVAVSG